MHPGGRRMVNGIVDEGAKAVERLTDAHVKQLLNYLAVSKLELGLLVNFGSESLEWKRVIRSQKIKPADLPKDFRV